MLPDKSPLEVVGFLCQVIIQIHNRPEVDPDLVAVGRLRLDVEAGSTGLMGPDGEQDVAPVVHGHYLRRYSLEVG